MTSDVVAEDVLIVGTLRLAEADVGRWLAGPITPAILADAPETFRLDPRVDGEDEGVTVQAWLDDLARYEAPAGDHYLDIARAGATLTIRGRVLRETYDAYKRHIAAIFRLAGACGARGCLVFAATADQREPFGYCLRVEGTTSTFDELRGEALSSEIRDAEREAAAV